MPPMGRGRGRGHAARNATSCTWWVPAAGDPWRAGARSRADPQGCSCARESRACAGAGSDWAGRCVLTWLRSRSRVGRTTKAQGWSRVNVRAVGRAGGKVREQAGGKVRGLRPALPSAPPNPPPLPTQCTLPQPSGEKQREQIRPLSRVIHMPHIPSSAFCFTIQISIRRRHGPVRAAQGES